MQRTRSFRNETGDKPTDTLNGAPPATQKQLSFLRSLVDERELEDEHRTEMGRRIDAGEISKKLASEWITRLLDKPKKTQETKAKVELPSVPAGRYALTGDDGTTDFYKVDRPEEGRWAGYTFVKLLIAHGGFGDDLGEQRIGFKQTQTILERIEETGPRSAMERYGKELGKCGHCGRTLTDNESIERGIGPVCAGRMGWQA